MILVTTNGLERVIAAETELSLVDGQEGILLYRGHLAKELAVTCSFEEVAQLLWYGSLPPTKNRLGHLPSATAHQTDWYAKFVQQRTLTNAVRDVIDALPTEMDMMSVIRTAVSASGSNTSPAWPPTVEEATRVTAMVPSIIAYRHAKQRGVSPTEPNPKLGHVENYLYMLNDGNPVPSEHVRALEAYLILAMEHGMNASTFAARVIASTESDITSAITGAIGAMKGPLHGGAPSEVMTMLTAIGTVERAESWLRAELAAGRKLMGFGHRIYKTQDPRAAALREVISQHRYQDALFDLTVTVEDFAVRLLHEFKPGRKLYANVEYWAAAILRTVGLPPHLYTPTFTTSRMVGWTAHVLEQATNNRLIRPQSKYVGPLNYAY